MVSPPYNNKYNIRYTVCQLFSYKYILKNRKRQTFFQIRISDFPISLNQSNQKLYEKGVDKGFDNIGLLSVDTLPQRIKKYTNYFEQQIQIGSFSIVPRRNNERLISQNGFFTIQGTSNQPLEEEVKSKEKVFLKKIILSNNFCSECKDFLNISGINYNGMTYIANQI